MAGLERYSALLLFECVLGLHANILVERNGALGKQRLTRNMYSNMAPIHHIVLIVRENIAFEILHEIFDAVIPRLFGIYCYSQQPRGAGYCSVPVIFNIGFLVRMSKSDIEFFSFFIV